MGSISSENITEITSAGLTSWLSGAGLRPVMIGGVLSSARGSTQRPPTPSPTSSSDQRYPEGQSASG
ncbi:MAG: hypothetical protein R3B48_15105 [Kofleriaceae bacterium]